MSPAAAAAPADRPAADARRGRVAVVDIGSNSIRLVVFDELKRAPFPLFNEKVMCGLGRGLERTGELNADGVALALDNLGRFVTLADVMGAERIDLLATAAVRDAANGPDFVRKAEKACKRRIRVLSGEEEARLSAMGVLMGMPQATGVMGDLGGGSLELTDVVGSDLGEGITLPLGGLALQDLSGGSLKKAQRIAREALDRAPQLAELEGRTFYAVGGTWRALARLHQAERNHPLRVMHGYVIDPKDGLDFLRLVERADAESLKNIESIAEARRPLLAYGALVLEEIIRTGAPKDIVISALGVREGMLFEKLSPEARDVDPLLAAASEVNLLRSRSPQHCEELRDWTDRFVESIALEETETERRLRHAACLLADIGWRAHPDYRGEQSVNLIAQAAFVGVDHPGRAYLALSVFFRHEGLSPDNVSPRVRALAGAHLVARARLLSAAMRVAYPISVAMEGVLPRAPLFGRDGEVVLQLPADMAPLANERLVNRMRQLAKLVDLDPRIEIA